MVATGAWMVATAAATVVSWTGVGVVSRAVTTAPDPVLPARIVDAVEAATTTTTTTTTSEAPVSSATADTTPTGVSHSTDSTGQALPNAHDVTQPSSSSTTQSPTTTTTAPQSAFWNASPSDGATYTSVGGQATVTCSADAISLVSASPSGGFQISVQSSGPARVELTFTGKPNEYLVFGCEDGRPIRIDDLTTPPSAGPGPQSGTGSGTGSGRPGSGGGVPGSGSGTSGGGAPGGNDGSSTGGDSDSPTGGSEPDRSSSH
jgi:hypothetical protein